MTIRLVLVDDHRLLHDALRSVLAAESDIAVVGEATDGRAALRVVRELKPDVVVLDVAMPDLNGMETAKRMRAQNPGVRILALSAHADRRYVIGMLEAGASGYLTKVAGTPELLRAIRAVARGEGYLPPELSGAVIQGVQEIRSGSGLQSLGRREREVLQLIAEGHRTKAIAARLSIAVDTVESHRRNIMRKLGLHKVADLTKFALREGLTSL